MPPPQCANPQVAQLGPGDRLASNEDKDEGAAYIVAEDQIISEVAINVEQYNVETLNID